jgi:hypothetical protein
MNERIKELANEAWTMVSIEERNNGELYEADRQRERRDQVFTELIVKECAGVTLDYKNHDHYTGWCDHAAEILKHFGVDI